MNEIGDLEFKLRRLPGVAAVGFENGGEDDIVVHVLLEEHQAAQPHDVRRQVAHAVREHFERPAVVEVGVLPEAGQMRPARVQVLAVRADQSRLGIEIHLAHRGRRTVGRAPTVSPRSAAAATIEALTRLGASVPFRVDTIQSGTDGGPVVVMASGERAEWRHYGIAYGRTPEDAACRAALHALNRYLERDGVFSG